MLTLVLASAWAADTAKGVTRERTGVLETTELVKAGKTHVFGRRPSVEFDDFVQFRSPEKVKN